MYGLLLYRIPDPTEQQLTRSSVQVNLAAESGEMGILAQHVPSIEQLKPGLCEIIEEAGGSKQFFRTSCTTTWRSGNAD